MRSFLPFVFKNLPISSYRLIIAMFICIIVMQGGETMKFSLFINKEREEEVLVFAHEETSLTKTIEKIVTEDTAELIGYIEREAVVLDLLSINCFVVEESKVYALTPKHKYQMKQRIYQLEEILPDIFVKVNQSCIANINMIKSFDSSISGSLLVKFKNGHSDYVSRRQLKAVKERFGL